MGLSGVLPCPIPIMLPLLPLALKLLITASESFLLSEYADNSEETISGPTFKKVGKLGSPSLWTNKTISPAFGLMYS
jgi:hypothetical protein